MLRLIRVLAGTADAGYQCQNQREGEKKSCVPEWQKHYLLITRVTRLRARPKKAPPPPSRMHPAWCLPRPRLERRQNIRPLLPPMHCHINTAAAPDTPGPMEFDFDSLDGGDAWLLDAMAASHHFSAASPPLPPPWPCGDHPSVPLDAAAPHPQVDAPGAPAGEAFSDPAIDFAFPFFTTPCGTGRRSGRCSCVIATAICQSGVSRFEFDWSYDTPAISARISR